MELQARFHGVGMSVIGCVGDVPVAATLGLRTLERRYGSRRTRLETHDLRDVDDHIDEGASDQRWGQRS
jgi:hypothetical protein